MRHFRYLGCLGETVCVQAGTLDELHQKIIARNKRNGFWTTFKEIDTWTEPGKLVLRDHGLAWSPT